MVLNLLWVYLRALEENLLNSPSGLLKSDSQFHLFIDNSWERGGVPLTPPCVPQKERRQRRNDHIWPARHSSYGHWRQTWFSYRARGRLGLSRVFVLNDVMPRVKTRPSLPPTPWNGSIQRKVGRSDADYLGWIKPVPSLGRCITATVFLPHANHKQESAVIKMPEQALIAFGLLCWENKNICIFPLTLSRTHSWMMHCHSYCFRSCFLKTQACFSYVWHILL